MIEKKFKKKTLKANYSDKRGQIIDILQDEKINSTTIITFKKKGVVRGNHFHKKTIQWNYVLDGEVMYYSQVPGKKLDKIKISAGDLTVSYSLQKHAFKSLKKSRILVLTKGPRAGKNYEIDTYRLNDKPLVK